MTSGQDKSLRELVGGEMMTTEKANYAGGQSREEQERAITWEELQVLVQAGHLSQEDADLQMRMRTPRQPHAPSHHTIDHKDVYDRLRDMIEQGRLTREDANTAQESPAGRRTLGRRTRTPASSIPRAARWRKS